MTKPLALVTGGAHRLGKAFVLTLARMGYDLLLQYHSAEEQAKQTKSEIESFGVKVHLFQANLTQPDQIQSLFEQLDFILYPSSFILLVNSAAIMPAGNPRELELLDWDSAIELLGENEPSFLDDNGRSLRRWMKSIGLAGPTYKDGTIAVTTLAKKMFK